MGTRSERLGLRFGVRGGRTRGPLRTLFVYGFIVFAGLFFAAAITHSIALPGVLNLPPTALAVVVLIAAATPMVLTRWRISLAFFFAWLMMEDLVRKFAGNALSVYFVKDLVYIVLVAGFLSDSAARLSFRAIVGRARVPLYLLMIWALILCVRTGMVDPRLPLLGMRLDFLYVPLVCMGAVIARDRATLRRWLVGLAVIGALACSLGIAQAVIGPTFLAPTAATPGLGDLVTIRQSSGGAVYRPTGPFVEPGRYTAAAALTIALSLAAILICKGKQRAIATVCAGAGVIGIWVSGGRSSFLLGAALVFIAILAPVAAERKSLLTKALPIAIIAWISLVALTLAVPSLFTSRLAWYKNTLAPGSSQSEWSDRWTNYATDAWTGVRLGGVLGLGTGHESLGKQYLYGGPSYDSASGGIYAVESGYGSIAIEWGVIGLLLWLAWSVTWFLNLFSSARAAPDDHQAAAMVITGWVFIVVFVQFYAGLAIFQNYITNAYIWFLSGVVLVLPYIDRPEETNKAIQAGKEPVRPPYARVRPSA